MGHVTRPRPFQGRFVICRLGLAMINPHTTFEVFTIIFNEEIKGTPNAKIPVLSHPLGDLGVTHRVHLWLDRKRIVDFLLAIVIIELFPLALMHAFCTTKRNLRFPTGVGHFECKF